jgi:hypothetical protein
VKRIILAFVLVCGPARFLQAAPAQEPILKLSQIIVPKLKIDHGSIQDALQIIEKDWQHTHPDESFPVVFLDSRDSDARNPVYFDCDFRQISAYEALIRLSELTGIGIQFRMDLLILSKPFTSEDLPTINLPMSPRVVQGLRLSRNPKMERFSYDVSKALERYGILSPPGCEASWIYDEMIFRNTPEAISKLKALFMLIEAGYSVHKEH